MYKHLLVPHDGSSLSDRALKHAIGLAKQVKARVTVVHVIEPWLPPVALEGATIGRLGDLESIHADAMAARAGRIFKRATAAAKNAKVASQALTVTNARPWEGIVGLAKRQKCDLVVMASHGRSGLAGLLLGSETAKVIAHAKTPVLVCR